MQNSLIIEKRKSIGIRIFLTVSLAFSFSQRLSYITLHNNIRYIVMLFWVIMAVYKKLCIPSNNKGEKGQLCRLFIKGNVPIKVIIYLYTLLLIICGLTENRFLSTNGQTFINAVSAIAIFYLFGESAFGCSVCALVISYWVAVICFFISGTYHFEFHDMAFASGFIVVYYF